MKDDKIIITEMPLDGGNMAIARSISVPLLTFRISEKRNISLSKATKLGVALMLDMIARNEGDLNEYEQFLIDDSMLGQYRKKIAESILKTINTGVKDVE